MTLEPGTLVWVPFPYSNLKARKRRPAVVISRREYNDGGADVLVCGITSNLANARHSILVSQRDLSEGKLRVDSRIKVDRIASLQRDLMEPMGRLRPAVLAQVYRELLSILPDAARA